MNRSDSILSLWLMCFAIILLTIPVFTYLPEKSFSTEIMSSGNTDNIIPAKEVEPLEIETHGKQVKGTFIEGTYGGDGETLNWLLAADANSHSYTGSTIDTLVTYNNELEISLLCLAKDLEVSPDGLVYTVTIRDDLKWSDGSRVTAEDYVYTLENLMFSDWLPYPYRDGWQEEVNGEMVFVDAAVVDETTFTITRQTVEPEFAYTIYDIVPYPKYIATKYEGDLEAFTRAPEFNDLSYTGNLGPYKFKEWIRNDRFVVERNPDYYLTHDIGAPYFEEYVTKIFGTEATMLAALEAGDITSCSIAPEKVSKFKDMEHINVYTVPGGGYTLVGYNHRDNGWEGLNNTAVRQALSMSVSKELIARSVYYGFAEPAYSFIPVTSPWYDGESVVKYGVGDLYDKKRAAEIFLQEGYGKQEPDGSITVVDSDGSPLTLTLVTTTGGGLAEDIAFLVKQELSDLGIEVKLELVPWENLVRKYLMNKVPGAEGDPVQNAGPEGVSEEEWDLVLMSFGTDILAPSGSSGFFTTEGGLNFFGYSNPEVDELFKRVQSAEALDEGNRRTLYAEISHLLSEEQPIDFLVFRQGNYGFQSNVKGVEPGISLSYNYYLWYFE